jgi:hypothetical protein
MFIMVLLTLCQQSILYSHFPILKDFLIRVLHMQFQEPNLYRYIIRFAHTTKYLTIMVYCFVIPKSWLYIRHATL